MTHPLESCVVKLNRVEEHAQALWVETGTEEQTVSGVLDIPPRVGDHVIEVGSGFWLRLKMSSPIDVEPHWAAVLGDAIHNLRSALDHLIWGVTVLDKGKVGRWTHFPIVGGPDGLKRDDAARSLAELTSTHRGQVIALQPYQRGNPDHLRRLARLDNDDKHQAIHTLSVLPITAAFDAIPRDCEVVRLVPNLGVSLDTQAEVGRVYVNVTGPKPEVEMTAKFVPDIRLSDGRDVFETLRELGQYVFASVVAPLAPTISLDFPRASLP